MGRRAETRSAAPGDSPLKRQDASLRVSAPTSCPQRRRQSAAIRAITFDVGGTLIEPWPSVGHVYAEVAARHGWSVAPQELNRRFVAAWRAQPQFAHTRAAWAELVDSTFHGLIERAPSETFFDELYDRFSEAAAWHVFQDVRPALERLTGRGLRLGVVSNWDERLRLLLERLELSSWFEVVVISCEAGYAKPHPAIFMKAAQEFDLPRSAILHVGDSMDNDMLGAKAAGLQARLLCRAGKSSLASAVQTLVELP